MLLRKLGIPFRVLSPVNRITENRLRRKLLDNFIRLSSTTGQTSWESQQPSSEEKMKKVKSHAISVRTACLAMGVSHVLKVATQNAGALQSEVRVQRVRESNAQIQNHIGGRKRKKEKRKVTPFPEVCPPKSFVAAQS